MINNNTFKRSIENVYNNLLTKTNLNEKANEQYLMNIIEHLIENIKY
jgi:hypothetical protein